MSASDRRTSSADLVGQKLRVDGRVGVVLREKKRLGRSTLHIVRFSGDNEVQELKLNRKGSGGTDFTVLSGTTESNVDDWEQLEALMDDVEHLRPPDAQAAAGGDGERRLQLLQARLMMLSADDSGVHNAGVRRWAATATASGCVDAGSPTLNTLAGAADDGGGADADGAGADDAAPARKGTLVGKQAILATLAAHEPLHATVTLMDSTDSAQTQVREATDSASSAVRFLCNVCRADGVGERWTVRRRFNDFHALHLSVGAAASSAASATGWGLPPFPSKWRGSAVGRLLSRSSANAQLEQRRAALERYIQALLRCESQLDVAARERIRDFVQAPGAASTPAAASTQVQKG